MGKQVLLISTVVILFAASLGACDALPSVPAAELQECPPEMPQPLNPYAGPPDSWVMEVYNHAGLDLNPSNTSAQYKEARSAAFKLLGQQSQRWSDFIDLQLADSEVVTITVTYLSPQLIEAVILNEALAYWSPETAPSLFSDMLVEGVARPRARGENLFLVTLSATRYGNGGGGEPITVDIPLDQLFLTNSMDQRVSTKRDDHSVSQKVRLTHGPFSALIGFQTTVLNQNECALLLDPDQDSSISITLESFTVDGQERGPQTWTIGYEPLLGEVSPNVRPDYTFDPTLAIPQHWRPSEDAPTPQMGISRSANGMWESYWQKMGCYIWRRLTFSP